LPDFEKLVAAGYDYLPVGGLLLRGQAVLGSTMSENGNELPTQNGMLHQTPA
jgi:hypothetical protein